MTIKEWHNMFDAGLNKVASNQYAMFEQDEKDNIFNVVIDRYVKEKFTKFNVRQPQSPVQNQQKGIDDLRSLIVKNKKIKAIVPVQGQTATDYMYEPNVFIGALPQDYLFLINDRSVVKHYGDNSPTADECECDINSGFNKFDTDESYQEYLTVLPFVASADACCTPSGNNLQLVFKNALRSDNTYGDVLVFDYFAFSKAKGYDIITKLKTEADKFVIINLILEYLNRFNSTSELQNFDFAGANSMASTFIEAANKSTEYFNAYWETYKDQYYPNSFILVSKQRVDIARQSSPAASTGYITDAAFNFWNDGAITSPMGINVELRIGAPTPNVIGGTLFSQSQFRQVSYSRMMSALIDYADPLNPLTIADLALAPNLRQGNQTTTDWVRNKMVNQENLYRFLNSAFAKPTKKEPLSTLASNFLFVYSDGGFVITDLMIDYIRAPRKVSLRYAQSCDLAPHTHPEIVDRAIVYALEVMQSPRYQSKLNEFQTLGS